MVKEVEQKVIKHGIKQRMSEDTRQEFIQGVLLEHCDCGMPEESLKYIQKLLRLLNAPKPKDKDCEDLDTFFHNDKGLKYTIYYMLEKYGLTEHLFLFESVPGRLTEKGHNLLDELNKLYPRNE